MKGSIIIIGIILTAAGFTTTGFINKTRILKTGCLESRAASSNQPIMTGDYSWTKLLEIDKAPMNQDLWYSVRGTSTRSVTKEIIRNAESLVDVISGYPTNWISDYISVEITTTHNGRAMSAMSPNNFLSPEQKKLLRIVDVTSDITINVSYRTLNGVTNNTEHREMNVTVSVIPDIEAEYIGGYDQMITYLKENSGDKIVERPSTQFQPSSILFTISEEGAVDHVKLMKTTGDEALDEFFIELIYKMPKWKPAEDSKGKKVKQQFEFNVGPDGC